MHDCDMKDAKKTGLQALIRQMQKLMSEGKGDEPQDMGEKMADVEEDIVEPMLAGADEEEDEPDEKQSFMKGLRPKPKGKSLTIIGMTAMGKKAPKGKGKMYG